MTTLRQKAHDEIDRIPEDSIEQIVNLIVSFREKETDVDNDAINKAFGMLNQYADPAKIELEEGAFERAMAKKHEIN